MRIGAIFPQTEIGSDPAAVRDWAQAVEAMGYRLHSGLRPCPGREHHQPARLGRLHE